MMAEISSNVVAVKESEVHENLEFFRGKLIENGGKLLYSNIHFKRLR